MSLRTQQKSPKSSQDQKETSQHVRTRIIFQPKSSENQKKGQHARTRPIFQPKSSEDTRPIFRPKSSAVQKQGADPLAFATPSKSFADHLGVRGPQVETH